MASSRLDSDYSKISPTAKLVAYFRKFSDIPLAEETARALSVDDVAAEIVGGKQNLAQVSWLAGMFEARYKCITNILTNRGCNNILELASGISPRGIIMSQDQTVDYIDTDLLEMIREKQALFREIGPQNGLRLYPNYQFRELNALNLDGLERVASLFPRGPIAVVSEGLIPYLSRDEKDSLARNVYSVLSKTRGTWIASDFLHRDRIDQAMKENSRGMEVFARIVGTTARDVRENAFDNEAGAMDFFKNCGFAVSKVPLYDETYSLSSFARLKIDLDKVLLPRLKNMSIWMMEPNQ